jgi:uncharacterized secreted protein with C-terminal beta-propeller domain
MVQDSTRYLLVLVLAVGLAMGFTVGIVGPDAPWADDDETGELSEANPGSSSLQLNGTGPNDQGTPPASVQQFGSAEAFQAYVQAGTDLRNSGAFPTLSPTVGAPTVQPDIALETTEGVARSDTGFSGDESGGGDAPERIGETNVQVEGLDELDTVKTDGSNFYYSISNSYGYARPIEPLPGGDEVRVPPPPEPVRSTNVIDATEPSDPTEIADIDTGGELLQTGDTLVVFESDRLVGYDVSDPSDPSQEWSRSLDDSLVTARESGGTLYVVTQTPVGPSTPCPIEPMAGVSVDCGAVYAPTTQTTADGTYTAISIDAESGDIDDEVSFVGTGSGTVVSMFPDSLYVTYTTGIARSDLRLSWASESDIVPAELADRIEEIDSYNISESSKQREIDRAIANAGGSGDSGVDPATLREDFRSFLTDNQGRLTRTGIVRVDVDGSDLSVGETGSVPGTPLNQFALDEYEGTLRVATTIPRVGDAESTNSLHVLDNESLEQEDAVTGMGEGQRVYAVRYEGDRAYVVTFRQVDPFYVIDFEEPRNPDLLGELKLPGFSSYLHPIDDDSVLGIGEESGQVKAALFDVSDPTDPEVADDLKLDSYWSAIADSHHAFTIDRRHEVFVLPAGSSAKVVSYAGDELEVVKEVTTAEEVTRARYVENSLYIFAGSEVVVLDETDWERTTTLDVGGLQRPEDPRDPPG